MKTFNNITKALLGFTALAAFSACDPTEFSKPDDGFVAAPTTEQISFTIAPTTSDFRFTLINTSSVKGYAMWDLGNGTTAKGDTVTAYYPLPNNYKIILKLSTNGGSGQLEKMHETTKTDYAIFTDAKYINLSGGVDALNGKTWVLDSLAKGHLGVGPAGSAGLDWWSADPLAKKSTNAMYGDELTFKINGFSATLKNFGNSYVKDFRKDNAAYSNPVQIDGDYVVTYNNPAPGSWGISEVDGKTYLTLTGDKPIFPAFDVGAVNGRYEILSLGENLMELVAIGGDNNAWHYRLIPKGYTKPTVTADMNVTDAGSANTYTIGLSNVVIPAGVTISKFDVIV